MSPDYLFRRCSGLETFRQTLDVFEKCLSILSTPVHLDFLTLTPFLLPLLASD